MNHQPRLRGRHKPQGPVGLRRDAEKVGGALPPLLAQAEHLAASVAMGFHGRRRAGHGEDFWQYRQAVPGDRGTVSLRLVDPFNTSRFLVQIAGSNATQRSFRRQDVRAVYLGYQYNFGKAPKVRVLRPEGGAPTPFGG